MAEIGPFIFDVDYERAFLDRKYDRILTISFEDTGVMKWGVWDGEEEELGLSDIKNFVGNLFSSTNSAPIWERTPNGHKYVPPNTG